VFLKRAQLFVAQVYGRFQGDAACPIDAATLPAITVFADYRVPQTLVACGIIKLTPDLLSRVQNREEIAAGSPEELEIRAATVQASDKLVQALNDGPFKGRELNALHIDYLLWKLPRDAVKGLAPQGLFVMPMPEHHRTITTDY
jgi:hypothetical protein